MMKQLFRIPELHTYFLSVFSGNLQCPGVAVWRVQAPPGELFEKECAVVENTDIRINLFK